MRLQRKEYLALTGLALLALSSCGRKVPSQTGGDYPTLVVETSDQTLQTTYSATIRGRQDVAIYPQVSGKITEVRVNEGQPVKKGSVLFVIDQIPYQAALRAAQADYAAAQVGVESAQLDYDSTKELHDNRVVSSYELQTSLNALHKAQATLAQAQAKLIEAENNLSYTSVTSPSDGVVGTLPYKEGALVSASMSEPLTTVSDNSQMYVYFSMNENKLLDMARRYGTLDRALSDMPDLSLKLSDGTIYEHTGRVASISGVINESTGTVSLRAEFPNPDRLLHSGANGSVIVPESYAGVIVIPQEATFDLQDKVFVYKVVDGVAHSTQITVSPLNDGKRYIVLSGLETGDEIVASGAGLLRDGVRVKASKDSDVER